MRLYFYAELIFRSLTFFSNMFPFHNQQCQIKQHYKSLKKSMSMSRLHRKNSPMTLKRMKSHNRVKTVNISNLGYDGKLPAIKKSAWSKQPVRRTAVGSQHDALHAPALSIKTDIAAPSKIVWSGRRLRGAIIGHDSGELNRRLFASQKIPRSWVLPGFKSTW